MLQITTVHLSASFTHTYTYTHKKNTQACQEWNANSCPIAVRVGVWQGGGMSRFTSSMTLCKIFRSSENQPTMAGIVRWWLKLRRQQLKHFSHSKLSICIFSHLTVHSSRTTYNCTKLLIGVIPQIQSLLHMLYRQNINNKVYSFLYTMQRQY